MRAARSAPAPAPAGGGTRARPRRSRTRAWRRAPGSWPPRSRIDRRHTGARPVRPGARRCASSPRRPASRRPGVAATPRIGIGYAGEPWAVRPVAVPRPGQPVARAGGPRLMDARSIALLEFPAVRARLAEKTSFDPSRRLAEALVPSADPVIVRRGLDETDQARALLQERPGVGIGAAHDIDPWVGRAARGGRLDPQQFLEIAETLDAAARLATIARRGAPAAAARPRAAASTRCRPCGARCCAASIPTGELLDTASPRLGAAARRGPRSPYDRLRRRLDSAGRLGARRRAPGADHHAAQRPLRRSRSGPTRGPGQGHRPRRVRERPDAVRRAARRRGARQRLARGPGGRGRGGGPDPRRALGARRRQRHAAPRDPRGARPVRLLGGQGAARGGAGRRPARGRRPHGGRPAVRAPPGADRARGADRPAARRRLHGARHHRAQHRRQDRRAADPRAPRADAPGRPARPGRDGIAAADLPRRVRGHRRRAVDRPVAVHVLGPPAVDHADRGARRPRDARAPRRAGRRHGPHRGLGAGPGAARPLHPVRGAGRGDDALRGDQGLRPRDARRRATRRSSSTSRRSRRPTGSRSACRAGRRRSRSPSVSACPDAIVADARSRLSENQRAFEATLASIRRQEGEIAEAVERARVAEAKAAEALRVRRRGAPPGPPRARRGGPGGPRGGPAPRGLASATTWRASAAASSARPSPPRPSTPRSPAPSRPSTACPEAPRRARAAGAPAAPRAWRLGERARSRSGGWEGRIAALEKGGTRATLEAGGMRVSVAVGRPRAGGRHRRRSGDAATGGPAAAGPRAGAGVRAGAGATGISSLPPGAGAHAWPRRSTCAGARVDEALDALGALPRRRVARRPGAGDRSSTASARARCATPCGRRRRRTRWSRASAPGSAARAGTAPRSSGSEPGRASPRLAAASGLGRLRSACRHGVAGRGASGTDRRARRERVDRHADAWAAAGRSGTSSWARTRRPTTGRTGRSPPP